MLESTIHWREGLGWHGLRCLTGPVHRDAIPILGALSLLAVAVHGAIEHLFAWARRLFAQLEAKLLLTAPADPDCPGRRGPRRDRPGLSNGARGPPAFAVLGSVISFERSSRNGECAISQAGRRLPSALACAMVVALIAAGAASAHARISPPVSLSNTLQLYSLAVPTEKENADDDEDRADRARRASRSTRSCRIRAGRACCSRPGPARTP